MVGEVRSCLAGRGEMSTGDDFVSGVHSSIGKDNIHTERDLISTQYQITNTINNLEDYDHNWVTDW